MRAAVNEDPQAFLERYRSEDWTVIDEVQRVPELLIALKREVDLDRRPGRYLLTGSTNVLTIPRVAESLAGRMELLSMWPLAQREMEGTDPDLLVRLFEPLTLAWTSTETRSATIERAVRGGYPEVVARATRARRNAWFGSYLATVVAREIKSISSIEDETAILRVLRMLASRSGGPRNIQSIAAGTKISGTTVSRYVSLLQSTFLITALPAWSRNLDKRLVTAPKLIVNDSGLCAHLLGLTSSDTGVGLLLETFVGAELQKLISWSETPHTLMHFRTRRAQEVDFVIERADEQLVGVEVKAATTVTAADFTGLKTLAEAAGDRFSRGVVLYCGERTLPFGSRLWAVPFAALWSPMER